MATRWMGAGLGAIALAGLAIMVGDCAEGREAPKATNLVEVTTGLTYTFGPQTWCANANSTAPSCSDAGTSLPILWPQVQVKLAPFAIDEHEVTNLQFEYCVDAGGCTNDEQHAVNALDDSQQDYYLNGRFDDYPVVNVTWDQADEYCKWVGKRLPTQFEWERVARGTDAQNRLVPSDVLASTGIAACTTHPDVAAFYCRGDRKMDAVEDTETDFVTEGGSKVYQMMGNAEEWVDDWYQADITCKADPPAPCKRVADCGSSDTTCQQNSHECPACTSADDCYYMCEDQPTQTIVCTPYASGDQPLNATALSSSEQGKKEVRGGSASTTNATSCQLSSTYRDATLEKDRRQPFIGFRCAKSL